MEYLEGLSKELTCSICLSVMEAPVARLPCCHYFCLQCITQSVQHKPQCPVCKARVGRRDVSRDETMDRVVTKFEALLDHKEELLAGIALNEETQYFSPAQRQQQLLVKEERELGLSQPAQEAALLPLPPSPAAGEAGEREGGGGGLVAGGAVGLGCGEAAAAGGGREGQEELAAADVQDKERESLGKRSLLGAELRQQEEEGREEAQRAKREGHGEGGNTGGEQAQQEAEQGEAEMEQMGGGAASIGLDGRPQPLAFVRGVANEHYESPTASVTSSALEKLLRWRRREGDEQGPKARRLSMPSAHSSPAKRAQQTQQAELGRGQFQEAAQQGGQQGAEERQLAVAEEPLNDVHKEQPQQAQQQQQQQQQPGILPAGLSIGVGASAHPVAQEGGKWGSRASSRAGGRGSSAPAPGSQPTSKWFAKQTERKGPTGQAAATNKVPAAPAVPAVQPQQALAGPLAAQQGMGAEAASGSPAPQGTPAGSQGSGLQSAAAAAAEGQAQEAAAAGDAAWSLGVSDSPGPHSPEGLSPGGLGRRLDCILQGLEQRTPPPAQLVAFQTNKLPAPPSSIPPGIIAAAAALAAAYRASGGGPAPAPAAADGSEIPAVTAEAALVQEGDAAGAAKSRAQHEPPAPEPAGAATDADPDPAEPSEAAPARGQGRSRPASAKAPVQEKVRRSSSGRPPRGKGALAAAAAAVAAAADGTPRAGPGLAPGRSSRTPASAVATAGVPAAAGAGAGVVISGGEGGGSGRRVPSRLVQWACEACTFLNEPQRRKCQMCSTPKPPASSLASAQQAQQQEGVGAGEGTPAVPARKDTTALAATDRGSRQEVGGGSSSAKRARLSLPGGASASQCSAPACAFCGRASAPSVPEECGELLAFELAGGGEGLVHEGCAKWAPNVFEDDGAPHGLANVASEVARARGLHCGGCGKGGAALGCTVKSCRSCYHLPCAIEAEGTDFDQASWVLYCPQHARGGRTRGCKGRRRVSSSAAMGAGAEQQQQEEEEEEEEEEDQQHGGDDGVGVAGGEQEEAGRSGAKRRRVSGKGASNATAAAAVCAQRSPHMHAKSSCMAGASAAAAAAAASGRQRRSTTPGSAAAGGAALSSSTGGGTATSGPAGGHGNIAGGGSSADTAPSSAGAVGTAAWQGPRRGSWVLLGSGLDARGREQLTQLAAASGASMACKWGPDVTHVVCGLVDGAARRTYKYLMGILGRKWVVSDAWVEACLLHGAAVDELGFQVRRDTNGCEGGAEGSRHSAALGLPPLLQGYEIFLAGKFGSREEVESLLKAAGARLLQRMPTTPAAEGRSSVAANPGPPTSFVLCESPEGGSLGQQRQHGAAEVAEAARESRGVGGGVGGAAEALRGKKWFQRAAETEVPVVSTKWLMESVGAYTPRPLVQYML